MAKSKPVSVHGTDEERGVKEVGAEFKMPPRKSKADVSRADFARHAKPLTIKVDDNLKVAPTKDFSSGSYGWFLTEKGVIMINGKPVKVQLQVQVIVVHSREEPYAEAAPQ